MRLKVQTGKETPPRDDGAEPKKPGRKTGTKLGIDRLESELANLYQLAAGGLYFVDSDIGAWTEKQSGPLAKAHAAWARENASVRRFLELLVSGGVAGSAIGVTVYWLVGCYLIVMSKRQPLPPAWESGAGIFGIPVMPSAAFFPDGNLAKESRDAAEPPPS